ncbi:MAG: DsrE family protein [Burkholderiaceae bacterium]|nr:DsrE family protein [Burkholderiaceae bacterium]
MNCRRHFAGLLASMLLVAGAAYAQTQTQTQDKVVYHIDNSEAQATKGLRNVRNHLDVAPNTKIVVVAHAEGIDFLMEGARDRKNPDIQYAPLVSALTARGVVFEICEITLKNRGLKREQFVMDAQFTPSGVARIAQLQLREGYAYIKP